MSSRLSYTDILKISLICVISLIFPSCSNKVIDPIEMRDVVNIKIGGFPRNTYTHVAITSESELSHDSLYKEFNVSDNLCLTEVINCINTISGHATRKTIDIRKVIIITMSDMTNRTICLGEEDGLTYRGMSYIHVEPLIEYVNNLLYEQQPRDFWTPDFLKEVYWGEYL